MVPEPPEGWAVRRLRELGAFRKGKGGSRADDVPTGIPVVRYGELYTKHHDVIRDFHSFIDEGRAGDYTPLQRGDLVLAGSGETATEIGKSAVYLRDTPAYTSGDTIVFRPNGDLDPLFLGYVSNGPAANSFKASVAQGASVVHIYERDLEQMSLPVPPVPEQRTIAAILSSVDDAIAATRKVIQQTERVKDGLLQTVMTRGIGHTRFRQTEIGEIPEEWEVAKLEDLAAVERGKFTARPRNDPKYYGGDVPFVQTGDVAAARLELRNHSQTLNQAGLTVSRLFPAGTILITIAANIGSVAEATYPVAFPDSLVGIQPRPGVSGRWLLYHLHTRQGELDGVATQNAQKNINLQVLRPLLIAVPPLREQEEIAAALDEVGYYLDSADQAVVRLQTLKRGLLQDLLTGRVRVTPD